MLFGLFFDSDEEIEDIIYIGSLINIYYGIEL